MNIAFGLHTKEGYYLHTLAAMHSVMRRASVPLAAHILHDETLDAAARGCFQKVAAHWRGTVEFYDVTEEAAALPDLPALERFSKGCLFRLFLPKLLPETTVLYLDSDIIALADVTRLFSAALSDTAPLPLWAVRDTAPAHRPRFREYIAATFGEYAGYFNSGVLLFKNANLNRLVPDFPGAVLELLTAKPRLQFPDQDALNFLFGVSGQTGYLSGKANFQLEYGKRLACGETALEGKLLHYSWHKPWRETFPAALPYWRNREEVRAILS